MYRSNGNLADDRAGIVHSIFSEESDPQRKELNMELQIVSIREDLDLLKSEIKKTLIDLREVVLKEKTVSMVNRSSEDITPTQQASLKQHNQMSSSLVDGPEVPVSEINYICDELENSGDGSTLKEMGDVFQWILETRQAGLAPGILADFLDGYANSKGTCESTRALIGFLVNIIREMQDDDKGDDLSVSLDVYGSYIARLAGVLNGSDRGPADLDESQSAIKSTKTASESVSDPSEETTVIYEEVFGGQSNSDSSASHSFNHRCSHCDEWHDSSHK